MTCFFVGGDYTVFARSLALVANPVSALISAIGVPVLRASSSGLWPFSEFFASTPLY